MGKKKEEEKMYPIISQYLNKDMGYETIENKFGIDLFGLKRKIDVFGYKWGEDQIETIGVECKYSSKNNSEDDQYCEALGQAISYLPFFDYVGICFIGSKLSTYWKGISKILSINTMGINIDNSSCQWNYKPLQKIGSIYVNDELKGDVTLRVSMILSFTELETALKELKGKLRKGNFIENEGGYVALNYDNDLQISCFFMKEDHSVYMGFNLEKKETFKIITANLSKIENTKYIEKLFNIISDDKKLHIDLVRKKKCKSSSEKDTLKWEKSADKLQKDDILHLIEIIREINGESHWRPHLTIYKDAWRDVGKKDEHMKHVKVEAMKLYKIVEVFRDIISN